MKSCGHPIPIESVHLRPGPDKKVKGLEGEKEFLRGNQNGKTTDLDNDVEMVKLPEEDYIALLTPIVEDPAASFVHLIDQDGQLPRGALIVRKNLYSLDVVERRVLQRAVQLG